MDRTILTLAAVALLAGCDNGRYQIAPETGESPRGVYRVDTRTGEVSKCQMLLDYEIHCYHAITDSVLKLMTPAPTKPGMGGAPSLEK